MHLLLGGAGGGDRRADVLGAEHRDAPRCLRPCRTRRRRRSGPRRRARGRRSRPATPAPTTRRAELTLEVGQRLPLVGVAPLLAVVRDELVEDGAQFEVWLHARDSSEQSRDRAVPLSCGRLGEVVEGDAADGLRREVVADPRRDRRRRARRAAAAEATAAEAAAADELVDLPVGHVLLELRERRRRVGAVEAADRHDRRRRWRAGSRRRCWRPTVGRDPRVLVGVAARAARSAPRSACCR